MNTMDWWSFNDNSVPVDMAILPTGCGGGDGDTCAPAYAIVRADTDGDQELLKDATTTTTNDAWFEDFENDYTCLYGGPATVEPWPVLVPVPHTQVIGPMTALLAGVTAPMEPVHVPVHVPVPVPVELLGQALTAVVDTQDVPQDALNTLRPHIADQPSPGVSWETLLTGFPLVATCKVTTGKHVSIQLSCAGGRWKLEPYAFHLRKARGSAPAMHASEIDLLTNGTGNQLGRRTVRYEAGRHTDRKAVISSAVVTYVHTVRRLQQQCTGTTEGFGPHVMDIGSGYMYNSGMKQKDMWKWSAHCAVKVLKMLQKTGQSPVDQGPCTDTSEVQVERDTHVATRAIRTYNKRTRTATDTATKRKRTRTRVQKYSSDEDDKPTTTPTPTAELLCLCELEGVDCRCEMVDDEEWMALLCGCCGQDVLGCQCTGGEGEGESHSIICI